MLSLTVNHDYVSLAVIAAFVAGGALGCYRYNLAAAVLYATCIAVGTVNIAVAIHSPGAYRVGPVVVAFVGADDDDPDA